MSGLPPNTYWNARAEQRMAAYLRDSEASLRVVGKAFRRANESLLADIDSIFGNYAKRHNLTPEQAKEYLSGRISHAEYERLLAKLPGVTDSFARADLLARINAPAAQYRMTRLEAVQASIHAEMSQVAAVQLGAATAGFQRTIADAYGRALWDIQRGTGFGWRVNAMTPGAVQEILRNPWSGMHYSTRVWENQKELAGWLDEELTAGMLSGRSVRRLSRELRDRLGVGYREAERLVRTETCYMANAAEMESYREAGITRYRFLATLDGVTSKVCRKLDGQSFDVAEALPGKNMPPMHPHCRSTTVADFGEEALSDMERRARDPVTGELMKVPADMTYEDWYTTFVAKWEKAGNQGSLVELRDIAKLEAYAKERLGIEHVNLAGMDPELAAGVFAQMERVNQEFPFLKGYAKEFTPKDTGIMAAAPANDFEGVRLYWNPRYFSNGQGFKALYVEQVGVGQFPQGTSWEHVTAHELGHGIEAWLVRERFDSGIARSIAWNDCSIAKQIVSNACKAAKKTAKGAINQQLIQDISLYATSNRSETLAEAVSDWMANGERAKVLSREIIKEIRRWL